MAETPLSQQPYWYTGQTDNKGQPVRVYKQPSGNSGFLGIGASEAPAPDGYIESYADGQVWDVPSDGSAPANLNTPSELRTIEAQASKAPSILTGPDKNKYAYDPATDSYTLASGVPTAGLQGKLITDKYGNQVQIPPTGAEGGMNGEPAQPRVVYRDPSADIQAQQDQADLEYKRRLAANVGAAPQRAPRYADEEQLAALQVQKAQQDLQNPYVLKQQQLYAAIANIEDQMRRGEVDPEQGHQMMAYARQNLDASLRGTTPFQMEQDRLNRDMDRRVQQQNVAQRLLDSQGQTAGSMTTGLVNGLGGIYGKINSSAFSGDIVNPLDFVSAVMNQYGGGTGLADSARGILQGLFQPQQGG